MKRQKKKEININLKIDRDKIFEKIMYVLGTIMFGFLIIKIFQFFLIPGAMSLANMLLSLWVQYQTLEGHYLFFGTVVMLFISWKIFLALFFLVEKCFEWMVKSLMGLGLIKSVKVTE